MREAGLVLLLMAAAIRVGANQPPHTAPGVRSRPNVVLVVCDSLDGRLTFYPGNQTVDLPFINFMKRYGTVFLNAYTNSPICCPSRAALWSGRFTHLTESWNNFKGLDPDYVTWMDLMEKYGYHTQKYGKLDYTSGHHSLSNRVEAWTRDVDFLLRQEGRPMVNLTGDKRHVRVMEADWQTTDKAVNWIQEEAINLTQPFVLYLGLNLPHPYPSPYAGEHFGSSTFLTSPYWLEKVTYEAIKIPKWSSLSEMHPVDYYSSYTKNCTGGFTTQEVRNIRAFYYAMCAETDAMLGEVISALRDTGLLEKTMVIFTADHGELAMEHRQFYKMSMYEGSSHVPLLVMGPGVKAQQQVPDLVSLVDIYPTMLASPKGHVEGNGVIQWSPYVHCIDATADAILTPIPSRELNSTYSLLPPPILDIGRIPVPQNLSGYSLTPLLRGKNGNQVTPPRPSWVLSEFHGCDVNSSTYMLRTGTWKYVAYADGRSVLPQLFDLSADPDELTNVAIKFPVTVRSLDKMLRSVIDYPKVSSSVHEYNKREFISWKESLGQNYSDVIANLRWHQDWLKEPKKYEAAIDRWLGQSN